jgi:hypothetical protein
MQTKKSFRKHRIALTIIFAIPALCLLIVATSALSNFWAPSSSQAVEHLDELQKARITEMLNLRRNLGDQIWSGFGQADIPIIVWNEANAFLIGLENPPAGWITIPRHTRLGSTWKPVPGDDFYGQPYYRQLLPKDGTTPQAFTVLIGDHWSASLPTKDWMLISLSEQVRQDFGPLFPHWLFARIGMSSTERYISPGLLHESFHAYQGITAPQRLEEGELANSQWADSYPWEDDSFQQNWQAELDILAEALQSKTDVEMVDLIRKFLDLRAERRAAAELSSDHIEFERQREWVEGLAKYTGMAQAFLLDRLMPEWKSIIFQEGIWLDQLLEAAID